MKMVWPFSVTFLPLIFNLACPISNGLECVRIEMSPVGFVVGGIGPLDIEINLGYAS